MDFIFGFFLGSFLCDTSEQKKEKEFKIEELFLVFLFGLFVFVVIYSYSLFPYKEKLLSISDYIIFYINNKLYEEPIYSFMKTLFSFYLYLLILYLLSFVISFVISFIRSK